MEAKRVGMLLALMVEQLTDRSDLRLGKRWRSRLSHLACRYGFTAVSQAIASSIAAHRRFDETGRVTLSSIDEALRSVRNILADQRSTVIADMNRRAMIQATAERN